LPRREIIKRIPGGKTLKIEVEVSEGKIVGVVLSGDFFAYPPEAFEDMERSLISADVKEIEEKIRAYEDKVVLLGLSIEDIISAFKELFNLS